MRKNAGVIQIIIVAGITIVLFGLFWMALTAPISQLTALYQGQTSIDSDIMGTVVFIQTFISILPLLCGFGVIAWGWVKTVEEREYGFYVD
jgi:hypothetical protein